MTTDAIAVAPHVYNQLLENDRVRVLEVKGAPGEKTRMHQHPDMVAIAINDCSFRFTFSNGQTVDADLKAGQAMFLDAVEHETEIRGSDPAHVLLIELK